MYNVCEPYHLAVEIGNIEHNFSWRIFYTDGGIKDHIGGDRCGRAGTAKNGGITGDGQTVHAKNSSLSCRIEICEW